MSLVNLLVFILYVVCVTPTPVASGCCTQNPWEVKLVRDHSCPFLHVNYFHKKGFTKSSETAWMIEMIASGKVGGIYCVNNYLF